MALQTSGAISIGDLRAEFGDTGTSSLSEFYRGGSLVPSTTTTYEPSATTYESSLVSPLYGFVVHDAAPRDVELFWDDATQSFTGDGTLPTSWVWGSWTYYRGPFVLDGGTYDVYEIRREQTTSINTGVPTSGTIDLADFYGATA